jgi:hypothetical protein
MRKTIEFWVGLLEVTRARQFLLENRGIDLTYIENSANTERRLDNVGCVLPHVLHTGSLLDRDQFFGHLDLAVTHTGNVNCYLAILLQI